MQYLKVKWIQTNPNCPEWLYSELDEDRLELRRVEVFANGTIEFGDRSSGTATLADEPVPPIEGMASDPQFATEEITREQFEEVWANGRIE